MSDFGRLEAPHVEQKRVSTAYCLMIPPLCFLGVHHLYLRRYGWFVISALTFNFLGFGVLVDMIRMCTLVRRCNEGKSSMKLMDISKDDIIIATLPLGFTGVQHLLLRRWKWAAAYFFTIGFLGFGWLIDIFRFPVLVDRERERYHHRHLSNHCAAPVHVDDLYILTVPFGFLGLQHFYLGNHKLGYIYLFTLGIFGVGWAFDILRVPTLAASANKKRVATLPTTIVPIDGEDHGNGPVMGFAAPSAPPECDVGGRGRGRGRGGNGGGAGAAYPALDAIPVAYPPPAHNPTAAAPNAQWFQYDPAAKPCLDAVASTMGADSTNIPTPVAYPVAHPVAHMSDANAAVVPVAHPVALPILTSVQPSAPAK